MFAATDVRSQDSRVKFGASFSASSTGSGFGTVFSPGFYIFKRNSQLELGLNIQQRKGNVSGGQLTYEYCVFNGATDDDPFQHEFLELFFFGNFRYNFNALLGNYQLKVENKIAPRSTTDFTSLRFTATEAYFGFGIKLKIEDRLKWVNAVGIGGWVTLKGSQDIYRDYNAMSLFFRTGLTYDF